MSKYLHEIFAAAQLVAGLEHTGEVSQGEHDDLVRRILAAYEQIINRAHSHDIKVIGATLTPFVGSNYYHPARASEADRLAVNEWIRTSGRFDAVIDFDKIARDPQDPNRILPAFDCGDHLHPSPAGYGSGHTAVFVCLESVLRLAIKPNLKCAQLWTLKGCCAAL